MPDMPAPAAPVAEPTTIPPPVPQANGAGALMDSPITPKEEAKPTAPVLPEDLGEFELDIKGQKQKVKPTRAQMTQILQKALYADQMIKDATQAKKGAEAMMAKLKSGDISQIKEIFEDPAIGVDMKKIALDIVRGMMDEEKLTPEQKEAREWRSKAEKLEAEKKTREDAEAQKVAQEKQSALATQLRGSIIGAMKEYTDLPQTQATMDACIQYMRANYRKHGQMLPPADAMKLVSRDYWAGVTNILNTMTPEKIIERFGKNTLDKLQALKLKELRDKTNPANQVPQIGADTKKKKYLTEKEYDRAFAQRIAGL